MAHHNSNIACGVKGCRNGHSRHGFCEMHAKRWMRHGDPDYSCKPLLNRFIEKVWRDDSTDCWIWVGDRATFGYGMIRTKNPRTSRMAHKVSYELFRGEIPKAMLVCHSCDNPPCVNPDHLFLGTQRDNLRDMMVKNRRTTKLTPSNVREIREAFSQSKSRINGLSKIFSEKFGVCLMTIQNARDRKTWTHV